MIFLFLISLFQIQAQSINKFGTPSKFAVKTPIVIAILDTGYDPSLATTALRLCPYGHYDYSTGTPTINSVHPHGTYIGNIIAEGLKAVDYCAIILQLFPSPELLRLSPQRMTVAIKHIIKYSPAAINISVGASPTPYMPEYLAFRDLTKKTVVFHAAGKNQTYLDRQCALYPICYNLQNLMVVGGLQNNKLHPASNFGPRVNVWHDATYTVTYPSRKMEHGTSYATPRALVEYIKGLYELALSQ